MHSIIPLTAPAIHRRHTQKGIGPLLRILVFPPPVEEGAIPFWVYRMRKKESPVADPVKDAEERSGSEFERKKTAALWQEDIPFCTTGQFARLDEGYRRHCGPTAVTNLILTLNHRYGYMDEPVPADIFRTVSQIGQKMLIYWNTDVLGRFGGTYDPLTEPYLRASLHHYKIPVRLQWHLFPSETQFIRELDQGKLLYLQLFRHPCYGTHHLLCYGYTTVHCEKRMNSDSKRRMNSDGNNREIYLLLADGWSRRPRYLRLKGRGICHFFAVSRK